MDIQQVNSRIIHEEPDTQFADEHGTTVEETSVGIDQQGAAASSNGGSGSGSGKGMNGVGGVERDGGPVTKHQTLRSMASFEETYPEGGTQAWLVVLGAFFALFSSMGLMNSIAMFQAYTLSHQLKDHSEGTVGWIFSIYTFLAFFGGVYFGPVFDKYGPRWLVICGAACVVLAMVGMSFCKGKSQVVSLWILPILSHLKTATPQPAQSTNTLSPSYRTLAIHSLLWHPRRRRHLPPLHALHRRRRPLVQAPPRLRNRHRHLRRWPGRHHLPAHAYRPL
jgi:hypothetical protein